jgi:hypothetical protein
LDFGDRYRRSPTPQRFDDFLAIDGLLERAGDFISLEKIIGIDAGADKTPQRSRCHGLVLDAPDFFG